MTPEQLIPRLMTLAGTGVDRARALAEGPSADLVAHLFMVAETFKSQMASAQQRLDDETRGAHDALSRAGVPVCRNYGDGPWTDYNGEYTLESRVQMLADRLERANETARLARSRTHDDRQMLPRSA